MGYELIHNIIMKTNVFQFNVSFCNRTKLLQYDKKKFSLELLVELKCSKLSKQTNFELLLS